MSLRNRTAERGGRQNGCMWQTWQGYYWHVLPRSPLNINVFLVFYKKICLKKVEVWGKFFSNKIIITLVTQGLRLRSSSVLLRKFTENGSLTSHLLQAPPPVRLSSAPGTWCPFVSGTVRDLHRWALTSQSYWSEYYPQIQRGQRQHLRDKKRDYHGSGSVHQTSERWTTSKHGWVTANLISNPEIYREVFWRCYATLFIGELKQRERQKNNSFILAKQQQQLCTCICTFSLPSLHDQNVKMPNFTFCRGREHTTTTFFFFSRTLIQSFRIQLQKKLPTFDELNEME